MNTFRLFAGLKLRLVAGNLRGAVERKIGFIFTLIAATFVAGIGFLSMSAIRFAEPDLAADLGVVVFSALVVGWAVIPLLSFGVDDTLDPSRLALFPLRTKEMAIGLFAASATGAWPLATLIALLGGVVGLSRGLTGALVGIVAVLMVFALCLVVSRLITTALSSALRSRRGRDALAVAAIGIVLLFQLPNVIVNRGVGDPAALLSGAAGVLRWTPPGLAATSISTGNPLWLVPVAVAIVVIGWLWIKALARALVTPDASSQAASVRASTGLLDRLMPDGPLSAVVYKELRYIRRDPRFRVGWLVSLVVVGVLAFSQSGGDSTAGPGLVIWLTCLGAVMIGAQQQFGNMFGADGRALWMNAVVYATDRDLRTDLRGRHLAATTIAVPLIAVLAVAAGMFTGATAGILPAMLLGWGLLGVAFGSGALTSVLVPYTIPDRLNAFTGAAPGQGGQAFLGSMGAMMATGVVGLPIIVPVVLGIGWMGVVALPYGVAIALLGHHLAAKIARMRMPEILDAVTKAA